MAFMIATMITGSIYPTMALSQMPQYKADANGFMSDVRGIQITQPFGEALVERAGEVRAKGDSFVGDVVDASISYEPPKGHIVDTWA